MAPSRSFKYQPPLSSLLSFFIEDISELILRQASPLGTGMHDTFLSFNRLSLPAQVPNPFLANENALIFLEELRFKIRELVGSFLEKMASKESHDRLTEKVIREEVEEEVLKAGYQGVVAENVASFIVCDGFSDQVQNYGAISNFLKTVQLPTMQDVRFIGGRLGTSGALLFKKESPFGGIMRMVDRVAATDASVLILGETGVGKELLAKEIHRRSPRRDGPFVVVNLSVLSEDLVESEMFGHERGAFTGASSGRTGKFEVANNGTLFLDEIGDISPQIQIKLLRFLQEKTFERVGSNETIHSDIRLITATNRDIERQVQEEKFREDLYYRICVFPIRIPSLRERFVDIPPLAYHFMRMYARKHNRPVVRISGDALRALMDYHFPGNVREMENIIVRAILMANGDTIERKHLIFGPSVSSIETIPSAIFSYFQQRVDETLNTLESGEIAMPSHRDRNRVINYLQDRQTELIRFLSLNKNKKIRNADYRQCFSCSSITARRHLKMLTQCGLLAESQTGHRGRGAHYNIMAPADLWDATRSKP
ncbi:MAG: sigma 54-interacting transcriptional regulator [Deltaproteobacteria bacterium]|nr:sigma 54-interacting transcriptional regulator [Deltaproteobacteria bacterium]